MDGEGRDATVAGLPEHLDPPAVLQELVTRGPGEVPPLGGGERCGMRPRDQAEQPQREPQDVPQCRDALRIRQM